MEDSRSARDETAPSAYSVPRASVRTDLRLDANEGPRIAVRERPRSIEVERCYPDATELQSRLARRFAVERERVLVTAGADDALFRTMLAFAGSGGDVVVPTPAFEMIPRYARMVGARVVGVPEAADGRCPVEGVLRALEDEAVNPAVVALVSPSNPTGSAATGEELQRVSRAAGDAVVLVDLAYAEYADEDLTRTALSLPNALVVRTFSKAWGLAGARVGWAMGSSKLVDRLRAVGNPYPVAGPSLELAIERLNSSEPEVREHVARVRDERERLSLLLETLGAETWPSRANFVLAEWEDPEWVRDALAAQGIAVRIFPDDDRLSRALRITCPGEEAAYLRLERALVTASAPEVLLFDLDGVLADVSRSYDRAVRLTARSFGVGLAPTDVHEARARGNANCDWRLTQGLLARRGVELSFADVKARFELVYQGRPGRDGLRSAEELTVDREQLERWRTSFRFGVVTGRPRRDAGRFLRSKGIADLFDVVIAREDAALKPSPEPVRRALESLDASTAWMIGDTPDDVEAARRAGVLPIGCVAPGAVPEEARLALTRAGAARVLPSLDRLEEWLP